MATLKHQVVSLIKSGAFEKAVELAKAAVEQDSTSAESWGVLSHAYEITGDIESAIQAANHSVDLAPEEPAYRFHRGWLHLLVDCAQDAFDDMKEVLTRSQSLGNDYYAEMAAFLAAESLRRMHRYGEAMAQCSSVREDFSVYVGMPLSKDSLVKACSRALRHTQAMAA